MTTKPARKITAALTAMPWAMTEDALRMMLAIAERQQSDPKAVEAIKSQRLDQTATAGMRDGVAVIPIIGPIARRMNMFTEVSGGTSLDLLARDFTSAMNNNAVKAIALNVDSPGGEANGVSEFANMVYSARGRKPIYAYVGGMGASAAYWIASAADKIIVDDTAMVGSIGVIAALPVAEEEDEVTFVSSQSPNKRIDPTTEAGAASIQSTVDSLAQVFVESVARNRGVSAETVLADFGQGGLFVGKAAVSAGLADGVGSFEGVVSQLAQTKASTATFHASTEQRVSSPPLIPATVSISASAGGLLSAPLVSMVEAPTLPAPSAHVPAPVDRATQPMQQGVYPMADTLEQAAFSDAAVPPLPTLPAADNAAMQARLDAYMAQIEQRNAAIQAAAFARAQAEFDRRVHEMEQRGQIEQFARAKTTTSTDQAYAMPCTAEELTSLLLETPSGVRSRWQTLLNRITAGGLVTFDEIGSSGAGGEEVDQFNAIVEAKVAAGMSRVEAIKQTGKQHPALYQAQSLPKGRR